MVTDQRPFVPAATRWDQVSTVRFAKQGGEMKKLVLALLVVLGLTAGALLAAPAAECREPTSPVQGA